MNDPERLALYEQYEAEAIRFALGRYRHIPPHLSGMIGRDDIEQEARIALMNITRRYRPDDIHKGRDFPSLMRFGIRAHLRRTLQLDIADETTIPMIAFTPPDWLVRDDYQTQEMAALEPSVEQQVIELVDGAQVSATLEAALLLLTEKQRIIIERRYGLTGDGVCWTLEEVGKLFETGRNKSSVKRQQDRALGILRKELTQSQDGLLELRQMFERRTRQKRAA